MTERCRETPSSWQSLSAHDLCFCRRCLAPSPSSSGAARETSIVGLEPMCFSWHSPSMRSQRNLILKSCSATHPCLPWPLRVSSVSKCSIKGLHLPTSPPRQSPGFHKNQSDDHWPGALQVSPILKPELCRMALAGRASQCPMDSSGDPAWVKDGRCQALLWQKYNPAGTNCTFHSNPSNIRHTHGVLMIFLKPTSADKMLQ